MDIAALILGIVSFMVSFTIFKDFSLICAVVGAVLGIISLVRRQGKGLAIAGIVLAVISIFMLFSDGDSYQIKTSNTKTATTTNQINKKSNYSLGDTFIFDGMQLTIGTSAMFKTVNNMFSEHNNATVIELPVTIKNVSTETKSLNQFYLKYFGSKGTQLDGVEYYFDNSVSQSGELRPNASMQSNFYLLYDGNGKYGIDFDNFSEKVSVEFNITK